MKKRTLILIAIVAACFYQTQTHNPSLRTISIYDPYSYYDMEALDLHIPDMVTSHKTELHSAIALTGLSMVIPEGFLRGGSFTKFFYDKDSSLEVLNDESSFYTNKERLVSLVNAPGDGSWYKEKVLYQRDFKFNGYDALILCVADTTRHKMSVTLSFGDEHFCAAVRGICKGDDTAMLDLFVNTMLSTSYEKHKA